MKRSDYQAEQVLIKDTTITCSNKFAPYQALIYYPVSIVPFLRTKSTRHVKDGNYFVMAYQYPAIDKPVEVPLNRLKVCDQTYATKPEIISWLEKCKTIKLEVVSEK